MAHTVDARGLSCPTPVIMTKKAVEEIAGEDIIVIVDNAASRENVRQFAESVGMDVAVEENDGEFTLRLKPVGACDAANAMIAEAKSAAKPAKTGPVVVYVASHSIGFDESLGGRLMNGFITNIKNMDDMPGSVIFVNTAVQMSTTNTETVAALKELEEKGVEILSCGACLEYFNLVEKLSVGRITDAHTVMQRLFAAGNVIRL